MAQEEQQMESLQLVARVGAAEGGRGGWPRVGVGGLTESLLS